MDLYHMGRANLSKLQEIKIMLVCLGFSIDAWPVPFSLHHDQKINLIATVQIHQHE